MTEKTNNIVLKNNIYTFIWKRWSWKTMLASIWGYLDEYKLVYSNFSLKYKDKKVLSFEDFDLYKKIDSNNLQKKLLIFDEWGINANSRNFASKINKLLSFFIFISRKFNIDVIFITQDFETIDVNLRRQTDYLVEVVGGLPRYIEYNIFNIKKGIPKEIRGTYTIEALRVLDLYNINYDTRDLSGFEKKLKEFFK